MAVDGPIVTFRIDRKLLGDPDVVYLRVYSAALDDSLYTEQTDQYPRSDDPVATYTLVKAD